MASTLLNFPRPGKAAKPNFELWKKVVSLLQEFNKVLGSNTCINEPNKQDKDPVEYPITICVENALRWTLFLNSYGFKHQHTSSNNMILTIKAKQ